MEEVQELLKNFRKIFMEILADNEVFDLGAQVLKKSHIALIKAGFTEEQATVIVAKQGSGFKMTI